MKVKQQWIQKTYKLNRLAVSGFCTIRHGNGFIIYTAFISFWFSTFPLLTNSVKSNRLNYTRTHILTSTAALLCDLIFGILSDRCAVN